MNINKIPIFCDFDNTLTLSTKELIRLLNIKNDTNVAWQDVKKYNCKDVFPNITHTEILECFASPDFFTELEFYDGVVDTLKYHEYSFTWNICTIGTEGNLIYKKLWCNENIPIPFVWNGIEKIGMGKETTDMSQGIIIDDHVDNLRSSNAKYKILFKGGFSTEWNTKEPEEKFIECCTWKEIKIILSIILDWEQRNIISNKFINIYID